MQDKTFNLFIEVINAANDGRYCHGNGAQWCIVDNDGNNVVIDTIRNERVIVDTPNQVAPHAEVATAANLERFLMNSEATNVNTTKYDGYYAVNTAVQDILAAAATNNVWHFNGGQTVIEKWGCIYSYDTTTRGQVTVTSMGAFASWKYKRAAINKQPLSDEAIKFFKSL